MKTKHEYKPMSVEPEEPKPQPKPTSNKDINEYTLEEAIKEFEKKNARWYVLINQRRLNENKTAVEIERESELFKSLVRLAQRIEILSQSQGSMNLSVIALRTCMVLNDKLNEALCKLDKIQGNKAQNDKERIDNAKEKCEDK